MGLLFHSSYTVHNSKQPLLAFAENKEQFYLRILLLILKELVMNCAVNLTFKGSLMTIFNLVFACSSIKLIGNVILLSQMSLSVVYVGQKNNKWISDSTGSLVLVG